MKKGIIFDMDGVIIDNGVAHDIAWCQFCKKYGIDISEEEIKKNMHGRSNRDILTYILKREIVDTELKMYEEEKENIYREIYRDKMIPVKGLIDFLKSHQQDAEQRDDITFWGVKLM